MAEPTYIFRDGNVYTLEDGKVTSSVKESDFNPAGGGHPIHGEVDMPAAPPEVQAEACPTCGGPISPGDQYCPSCGLQVQGYGQDDVPPPGYNGENLPEFAPHTGKQIVTTPNGLKGRVLARVPSLWGEEVTVRFENGNIIKLPVDKGMTFTAAEEAPAGETPVERLEERLAATYDSDKISLYKRVAELESIRKEAGSLVAKSSDVEASKLDSISVQAEHERLEIGGALAHIEASESVEAPAPIESLPIVEQASMGGSKANWLDQTVSGMVAEANSLNYEKIMDEGPEAFVASLNDTQLADAKTVRIMASREIRSHTAGADENIRETYERVWLARCEEQRKTRLASRKEEVRKEASTESSVDAPDESLFM